MIVPPTRPATREDLMLWVMHRFSQVFGEHAIIKGGMALRLLDSPRATNDIDYVAVILKHRLSPGMTTSRTSANDGNLQFL